MSRRRLTCTAVLATLLLGAVSQVLTPALAPAATAAAPQPAGYRLYGAREMVVDEPRGKIFVNGQDYDQDHPDRELLVTDLTGKELRTIHGIGDGTHVSMTFDRSVLLVWGTDDLVLVDPISEQVVKTVPLGTGSCPNALAEASGKVFFTSGGCNTTGTASDLRAVDLVTGVVTSGLGPVDPVLRYAELASVPGAPSVLAVRGGNSVAVLDTTGGPTPTATVRTRRDAATGLGSIALTPNASRVLVGQGKPASFEVWATADLATVGSYPAPAVPHQAAVRSDGTVAIGSDARIDPDLPPGTGAAIRVFKSGSSTPTVTYPGGATALRFGSTNIYALRPGKTVGRVYVEVLRPVPFAHLTLTTDRSVYSWRAPVTVTATLSGPRSRTVRIYATPRGLPERLVKAGPVSTRTGKLSVTLRDVTRKTTFRAVYADQTDFQGAEASRLIRMRSAMVLSSASRSRSGRFHKLPAKKAVVRGAVQGTVRNTCVGVRGYRYAKGRWRSFDTACVRMDRHGRFFVKFVGFKKGTKLWLTAQNGDTGFNESAGEKSYYVLLT